MTPLTHKLNQLLVPDPEGRPMAPETEALLRAAAKAEERSCRRAVIKLTKLVSKSLAKKAVDIIKRDGTSLDRIYFSELCNPTDKERQTLRKALRWLAETPEGEWPEVMRQ